MKKVHKILIFITLLFVIWTGTIIYSNILTAMHGDEFADPNIIGFTGMHPWEGEPNFRVLFYSKNKATVYYYGMKGGEKAVFINDTGKWHYSKTTNAWSDFGGTADDYFIWPYFKNWVI